MLPRTDGIIGRRRHDHKSENCNPPIHVCGRRLWRDGKETHDEAHGEKGHSGVVDGRAEAAEGPAAGQERLVAEALEADAADGGHIGENEGGV